MAIKNYLFTSESVSEGHPDKICDQISDAILDECLRGDPMSRVAMESLAKTGIVVLAGEITTGSNIDYEKIVRNIVREIGYTDPDIGFDADTCRIIKHISQQSQDISMGVDEDRGDQKEQGAGDQGLMFGFACDETKELMPLPIMLAHNLVEQLSIVRKSGVVDFLRPDAKSQVSVNYVDGKPRSVETVVLSTQHTDDVDNTELRAFVTDEVIKKVIPAELLSPQTRLLINPTGRFVVGGPHGDCGLTGRKIIIDTYGGYSRHGGGAFSGKDPTKVDRSAAYAARHVAKNIVGAGLASKCEVQIAYAIGVAEPVSIYVDTFGTGKVPEEKMVPVIREIFGLTPKSIIDNLQLRKPIFLKTAAYGHFGRSPTKEGHFSWEQLNKVAELQKALG
ncbi:MAG: methionine adenosyltransferase [bacterium]|nr:methionine adenosyltransferase [bacterium]